MVPETLKQRNGFSVSTYTLDEDAVVVREAGPLRRSRYRVPYVTLASERFETTVYSKLWLGLAIVTFLACLTVFIGEGFAASADGWTTVLVYGLLTVLFGMLAYHSWQRIVGFESETLPLVFRVDKPTPQKLEAFLGELLNRKTAYLRQHYLVQTLGSSPTDELQKLVWLKERGAINDEEYDLLKLRVIHGEIPECDPPEYLH